METIIILAQALAKAAKTEIRRIDIQYNTETEEYIGHLWLDTSLKGLFEIHDDGTVINTER